MSEKQINPYFNDIIEKCLHELDIKFPEYGNTWMVAKSPYWFKRIENEFEEYKKSMTDISAKRKLLNMINMCSMAYENLDKGRMKHND